MKFIYISKWMFIFSSWLIIVCSNYITIAQNLDLTMKTKTDINEDWLFPCIFTAVCVLFCLPCFLCFTNKESENKAEKVERVGVYTAQLLSAEQQQAVDLRDKMNKEQMTEDQMRDYLIERHKEEKSPKEFRLTEEQKKMKPNDLLWQLRYNGYKSGNYVPYDSFDKMEFPPLTDEEKELLVSEVKLKLERNKSKFVIQYWESRGLVEKCSCGKKMYYGRDHTCGSVRKQ